MRTIDFDYHLPPSAIGQPPPRRDRSRLLVLNRTSGRTTHRTIRDLPTLLHRGDLLVLNDTKVFRARLHGTVAGKEVELLLVRPSNFSTSHREGERPARHVSRALRGVAGGEGVGQSDWLALGKPAKRLRIGATITIGKLRGTVSAREDDGSMRITFNRSSAAVIAYANRIGEIPTPPYVAQRVARLTDYQTSYARHVGSVAAPTAGFHLTPRLLRSLRAKGVRIARITLHVGLGTFQPIRTDRIEDHTMHPEWAEVPATTARAIANTKARGGRIIAVGTTTLRTLEGAASVQQRFSPSHREGERPARHASRALRGVAGGEGVGTSFSGWLNIFITPGFHFRVADALLTNFHLPKSTLLVLVSAFAAPSKKGARGRDLILRAYRTALRRRYHFYSFGDAMFIQ